MLFVQVEVTYVIRLQGKKIRLLLFQMPLRDVWVELLWTVGQFHEIDILKPNFPLVSIFF